jgi:putative transposase
LFYNQLAAKTSDTIRQSTNKAWVLDDEKFKQQIEMQIQRRVEPASRGGDRKSQAFRDKTKNQLL